MQEENVGAEREDINLGRLMEIKHNIYNSPWGLPEIAGETGNQSHRGLKPREKVSKACVLPLIGMAFILCN